MSGGELERGVLGALLSCPGLIGAADGSRQGPLRASDFRPGRLREAFLAISSIQEELKPSEIDPAILISRLGREGAASFVGELLNGSIRLEPEVFFSRVVEMRRAKLRQQALSVLYEELKREEKTGTIDEHGFERIRGLFREIDQSGNGGPGAMLRSLADIDPQPVFWTWPNRIPRGKLTLIVGDPGLGKSFLCVDLAARISRGAEWPDLQEKASLGSVLLLTAEDGLADTVRPRADAAGADVSRLIVLDGVKERGEKRFFSLAEHIPILEAVIKSRPNLSMIIIDPISAYLGDLDSHKNAEVRGALAPLSALAENSNVSIVGVSHLNKSTGGEKAIYRIMGSLSFVAAARACWGVIADPDDQDRRLFVPVKTNLSINSKALGFRIEGGRIVYDSQPVQIDADEGFNSRREDREERSFSEAWLREVLQDGPQDVKEIMRLAKDEAIPSRTIYRAALKIGVIKHHQGFGKFKSSTWEMRG